MSNSIAYLGKTYTDAEIISGSFSKSESLNMAELPVDTVELTIRPIANLGFRTSENYPFITADGYEFETTEGNPLSTSFQQNTPIVQYRDGSQTAIWYLQSIDRIGADVYKLNGISSLGRLTQRTHYGGIYNGVQAQTIIAEIMGDMPYYVDNVFKTVLVYGWLPIATARDNLQQLLFALNANVTTDANGTLRIENLPTATAATVAASDIFQSNANVKYNTPITEVVVLEHQYVAGSDTQQLFDGAATGNQTVTFNEPMSGLTASAGLTIVESGANYAVVSGTGTLTGTPYIHMTREVSKAVSTADIDNIVRVENATLVGITASADVVNRLAAYYACRNVINVAVAAAFLNVGDTASVYDPFDQIMRSAVIEKCQVGLSATPKSTISALVGFVPWQQEAFDDVHVIITQSGIYTFPNDIDEDTEVAAILIGGGQGGYNGENGEDGTGGMAFRSASNGTYTVDAGAGGAGGAGGAKGIGGKILRISFSVDPSDSFPVTIGAGGAANGGIGGDTVFGNYSSATGASSETGYYDAVSQKQYGIYGTDGESGTSGGNGGSSQSDGQAGSSLASYNGGAGGIWGGSEYVYPSNPSYSKIYRGGGGGGGASASSNGEDGEDVIHRFESPRTAVVEKGSGGAGGNGSNGAAAINYGDGGSGGGGGGGGGGAGGTSYNGKYVVNTNKTFGYAYANAGGAGGAGGAGSAGKQGCVILIYRKPAS